MFVRKSLAIILVLVVLIEGIYFTTLWFKFQNLQKLANYKSLLPRK